jgi:hypothetical protein
MDTTANKELARRYFTEMVDKSVGRQHLSDRMS